jgi:glycosyltransferase involved in cell wall biosynthesis
MPSWRRRSETSTLGSAAVTYNRLVGAVRVALVHDWLTGMRGGERCLEAICELFPDADLFTLLHVPGLVSPIIEQRRITTSFLQRLPGAARHYRHYLPLMPAAVGHFDLRGYDLVVSSSHCVAKGARPAPGALHVCYCFTPMRYVWDRYDDYVGDHASLPARLALPLLAPALRAWDRSASRRVQHFVAISEHVRARVRRCYGRDATVIYPPVDVQRFELADGPDGDFYLVVSALVPYKRIDLAVLAAGALGRRLLVVGTGPEEVRLRALAGPTVEFLGRRSDADVARLYRACRAVLFPGCEDFGIVPLEAMAAGRPVIALKAGGALETIVPPGSEVPPTGLFFEEQSVAALAAAIRRFEAEAERFHPKALRARAELFNGERFRTAMRSYLETRLAELRPC